MGRNEDRATRGRLARHKTLTERFLAAGLTAEAASARALDVIRGLIAEDAPVGDPTFVEDSVVRLTMSLTVHKHYDGDPMSHDGSIQTGIRIWHVLTPSGILIGEIEQDYSSQVEMGLRVSFVGPRPSRLPHETPVMCSVEYPKEFASFDEALALFSGPLPESIRERFAKM